MPSPRSKSATPPSGARRKRLSGRVLSIVSASMMLASCATLTKPSPESPSPLVIAACPELTPLTDNSFGATTMKLIEVAGIYRECRSAALAGRAPTTYNDPQ